MTDVGLDLCLLLSPLFKRLAASHATVVVPLFSQCLPLSNLKESLESLEQHPAYCQTCFPADHLLALSGVYSFWHSTHDLTFAKGHIGMCTLPYHT